VWFSCRIFSRKLSKKGTRHAAWGNTTSCQQLSMWTPLLVSQGGFYRMKAPCRGGGLLPLHPRGPWAWRRRGRFLQTIAKDARHQLYPTCRIQSHATVTREGARNSRESSQSGAIKLIIWACNACTLLKELWAGTVLWRAIGRDAREDNPEFRNNVECERTVNEGFCGETNVAYSITYSKAADRRDRTNPRMDYLVSLSQRSLRGTASP